MEAGDVPAYFIVRKYPSTGSVTYGIFSERKLEFRGECPTDTVVDWAYGSTYSEARKVLLQKMGHRLELRPGEGSFF